jgi:hypothetical protein
VLASAFEPSTTNALGMPLAAVWPEARGLQYPCLDAVTSLHKRSFSKGKAIAGAGSEAA